MEFSASSILTTIFTGVVAGLAGYFASYAKVKAEVRAATEDLRQTIQNLTATTRAVELEKARIAADASVASDKRKTVYALASATQSLIHSMCWLSWDTKTRLTMNTEMASAYNAEAHRLLPEIFSQLAVLRLLDPDLHERAYRYASKLTALDVLFGEAIIAGENDRQAGVEALTRLYSNSNEVQFEVDKLFGGQLKISALGED
jgi:hypothetical protein